MSKVTTGEELKTRFLADFIDDLCDSKIITRDGPLSIPYNFLESICGGNTIGGTRERKMKLLKIEEVTVVQLVKALTFHKPKPFNGINSKNVS